MEDNGSVSLRLCLDGHANSLALNKENNCIAVAGRSLLKVLSIESDGFTEVHNLRQQQSNNKSLNLTFSSNAIAWSHIDVNILATSATNGAVSIWDINKFGRNKQLNVYHDHDRTTHAVTFHQSDPHLLLSASQDSTLKLFDLREKASCCLTFISTESVRDCKFNPFNSNAFASVSENGTVQLFDIRRTDKFLQQFTAHAGPIYCLDYHPTQPWLATGSRDKLIKVWNMSSAKPSLEYSIHTIAVVGRVKWRPERKYHIASCSLVVDYSIYVWDVRRPFIPYFSFNEHSNVTTDICFKGVPDVLLSTSKDSTIYKHLMKDAQHPADASNPQSSTINFKGDFLFVSKVKPKPSVSPILPSSGSTTKLNFLKKTSIDTVDSASLEKFDTFHLAKSSLHYFTMDSVEVAVEAMKIDDAVPKTLKKDFMFFSGCAIDYKLTIDDEDGDFLTLFEYNANVAKKHGRANVAILWNFVKMIYKTAPPKQRPHITHLTSQNSNQSSSAQSGLTRASGSFGNAGIVAGLVSSNNASSNTINPDNSIEQVQVTLNGSANDDLLESSENCIIVPKVAQIPDLEVEVFDDENIHGIGTDIDSLQLRNGFLFTGPHDSFIKEFPACSSSAINHDLTNSQHRYHRSEVERESETSPPPDPPCIISVPETSDVHVWKPFQVLAECLILQSEVGDVQTPTSILICLKDRRDDLPIDTSIQENWLQSYVDLLHRHQMWNQATEIINLSWVPEVSQMNQKSTVIQTLCGECGRSLQNGWYCKYCKSTDPAKCVVCGLVVKGLYAWCCGCCHGGHIEHLIGWFQKNPQCPKCNHMCEYD